MVVLAKAMVMMEQTVVVVEERVVKETLQVVIAAVAVPRVELVSNLHIFMEFLEKVVMVAAGHPAVLAQMDTHIRVMVVVVEKMVGMMVEMVEMVL